MTFTSQQPCEDTTNANIQSSLPQEGIGELPAPEPKKAKKQSPSDLKTDRPEPESKKVFTLSDLRRLTFKQSDGQVVNVRTCQAAMFNAYVSRFVDVTGVDVNIWPAEDRRNVVNVISQFAREHQLPFPFTDQSSHSGSE